MFLLLTMPFFAILIGFIPIAPKFLGDFRTYAYITVAISLLIIFKGGLQKIKLPRNWHWLFFSIILFSYLTRSLNAYFSIDINGYDFSIFDWMLHNFTHNGSMYSPIYRVNHFGVHTSWYLGLLAPFHYLANSNLFLVIVGPIFLAAAILPLYALCKLYKIPDQETLFVLFAYSASSFIQILSKDGFRIESALPLFLFVFLYYWQSNFTLAKWLSVLLFLSCKEDIAIYLMSFAFFEFFRNKKDSCILMLVSSATFVFNCFFVQPYFLGTSVKNPEYLKFWGNYGKSLNEIIQTMALSPWQILKDIASSGFWKIYAPLFFLPFLARKSMALTLPGIFILGTARTNQTVHQYSLYYPVLLAAISFFSFIEIFHLLRKKNLQKLWSIVLLISTLFHAGSLKTKPLSLDAYSDLQEAKEFLEAKYLESKICTQTAAFPYLGYKLKLFPLDDLCLKDGLFFVMPEKNPYPQRQDAIKKYIEQHKIIANFGSVFILEKKL